MVSDDEGAHAAPKRLARAKRADSPVSTVSTAISTAAATVSEGLGWAGLGDGLGVGDGMMGKAFQVYFEKSLCWDD